MSRYWQLELTKETFLYTITDLHGMCRVVVVIRILKNTLKELKRLHL